MSILKKSVEELQSTGDTTKYLPPDGAHKALCVAIVDLGQEETAYGLKPKVQVVWALGAVNDDGEHFLSMKKYTPVLNDKSNLSAMLKSTKVKIETLSDLVGTQCTIMTQQEEAKNGKTYANISGMMSGKDFKITGKVALPPWFADYTEDQIIMLDGVEIREKESSDGLPY